MMVAFESSRVFQIWTYTVSHRQLLLRSTKGDGGPTRVEVLFKNVKAMKVAPQFDGLRITELDGADRSALLDDAAITQTDQRVWQLESSDFRGYVAAGVMVAHEDDGEYDDPSALLAR